MNKRRGEKTNPSTSHVKKKKKREKRKKTRKIKRKNRVIIIPPVL
jgi:hypothetical protein